LENSQINRGRILESGLVDSEKPQRSYWDKYLLVFSEWINCGLSPGTLPGTLEPHVPWNGNAVPPEFTY